MSGVGVSVIIPTYNHGDYVLETLDSVFAQSLTDYEIIVVNDGSPDETAGLLRPLEKAGRIRYIEQSNAGQAVARNRGLAEAKGEFIAFLDDDDTWPSDKLEWQVNSLKENPDSVLVYGYALRVGGSILHSPPLEFAPSGWVTASFSKGTWISSPGQTMIRTQVLRTVGGFDSAIWGADDWDLYIRLSRQGQFRFVDRCALHYRVHATNAIKQWWRMYVNARKVVKKNFPFALASGRLKIWYCSRRSLAELSAAGFIAGARNKEVGEALCLCAASVFVRPSSIFRRSHWRSMYAALTRVH